MTQHRVDNNNSSYLNLMKSIYRSKFCEKAKELIESYQIEAIIDEYCNESALNETLEMID